MNLNLEIYTKVFNLLRRIYPILRKYSKLEKFALAQDIKLPFFNYLSFINRTNIVKSKRLIYAQEAAATSGKPN